MLNSRNISVITSTNNDVDDAELQTEYDRFIQIARIQNAIPLSDFLNAKFEEKLDQKEMTEEEILQLVQKVEEDSKQEEVEHVDDMPSLYLNCSIKEKLMVLAYVKAMLKEAESNK